MVNIFHEKNRFQKKQNNFFNAQGSTYTFESLASEFVPNWSSLSCDELPDAIQKFKDSFIETYLKYAEAVGYSNEVAVETQKQYEIEFKTKYDLEIKKAEEIYQKCIEGDGGEITKPAEFGDRWRMNKGVFDLSPIGDETPIDTPTDDTPPNDTPELGVPIVVESRMPTIGERNANPILGQFLNKSDGGGGGGAQETPIVKTCECPDKRFINLGLFLIALGTLVLAYEK